MKVPFLNIALNRSRRCECVHSAVESFLDMLRTILFSSIAQKRGEVNKQATALFLMGFFAFSGKIPRCVSGESMLQSYIDMVSFPGEGKGADTEKIYEIRRNALEQIF